MLSVCNLLRYNSNWIDGIKYNITHEVWVQILAMADRYFTVYFSLAPLLIAFSKNDLHVVIAKELTTKKPTAWYHFWMPQVAKVLTEAPQGELHDLGCKIVTMAG